MSAKFAPGDNAWRLPPDSRHVTIEAVHNEDAEDPEYDVRYDDGLENRELESNFTDIEPE